MNELPRFVDEKLWIILVGDPQEKKLYLFYNPHTFKGRMGTWDPRTENTLLVSKNEIGNCSEEAKYWIKGFICGNEPDPPLGRGGYELEDEDDPKLLRWREAVALFRETGLWVSHKRKCKNCGEEMLPSQPGILCGRCLNETAG